MHKPPLLSSSTAIQQERTDIHRLVSHPWQGPWQALAHWLRARHRPSSGKPAAPAIAVPTKAQLAREHQAILDDMERLARRQLRFVLHSAATSSPSPADIEEHCRRWIDRMERKDPAFIEAVGTFYSSTCLVQYLQFIDEQKRP
jgi:hypothetical protein